MRQHTTCSSSRSLRSSFLSLSTLASLLLTFPSPSAAAFDCKDVEAQGVNFNFGKLGGPHLVHWAEEPDLEELQQFNYTFHIDICNRLEWRKGGNRKTECEHGTRICAIREDIDLSGQRNTTIQPIEIAGDYATSVKRPMDAKFELLRNSKSHSDAGREGVRFELHGGRYPFNVPANKGLDQRAIIEFVCDKDRDGLENDEPDDGEKEDGDGKDGKDGGDKDSDKDGEKDGNKDGDKDGDKKEQKSRKRDDNKDDQCEKSDKSLRFCGYKKEDVGKDKEARTLRLEWRTKYACEDAPNDTEGTHWGFFTWFIIILFLAIAAYLIFGSWLNYNRYGARGWDLLPHGDTIRDIPYILKDWARRVKDTLQGPGSRGGYAAV